MKPKILRERGQALILIALGAIALFAITGLAIDGSAKMSDRRHAQNAADTAAIAGALKMAQEDAKGNGVGNRCPPENGSPTSACADVVDVAKNRASQNGFTDDKQRSIVEIHIPPVSGVYAECNDIHFDCKDYVQVIITSNRDTWFMRVLGITRTTNVVYAVASKLSDENFFDIGGSAVVALKPDGCALMSQGGTNLHVVGGGLYSNSDDPSCSFKKDSCAGITDIDLNSNPTPDPGSITTIGGMSINTGCPPDASLAPAPSTIKQIPFPPPWEEIDPPVECSQPLKNVTGTTVTLSPGHYASMPPKPNMKNVTLKPGVYCIDKEIRIGSQDSFIVQGTFKVSPGVFLYIKPGGSFTINAGSVVVIWGINQANVAADATLAPYKGYLIYAAPNYGGTPPNCTINGGNSSWFQGTIYAPYCNLTLNGGSGSDGFQSKLIAYTVKFSGTSDVYLTYDEDSSPDMSVPLQVGLSK